MPFQYPKIQHHQRILITGARAHEIIKTCTSVLEFHKRAFSLMTSDTENITNGTIVFIEGKDNLSSYDPHIVLIDTLDSSEKSIYEDLANALPKAGTLVFNKSNPLAKSISSSPRSDIYLEEFTENTVEAAAKSLLKRIGISDKQFAEAL